MKFRRLSYWMPIVCACTSFYLEGCGGYGADKTEKVSASLTASAESVPQGATVSFDASLSVFDKLEWTLGDKSIKECKDQETCAILLDKAGVQTVSIKASIVKSESVMMGASKMDSVSSETATVDVTVIAKEEKAKETSTATATKTSATAETTTFLIGGSIQGKALNLAATSTTTTFSTGTVGAATGITFSGDAFYITVPGQNKIKKIDLAGTVTDFVGGGGGLNTPSGITNDGIFLYVTDTVNRKIFRIDIASHNISLIAGGGTPGSGTACPGHSSSECQNGTGAQAIFQSPEGITTDGIFLYVADRLNHLIRKVLITNGLTTSIGTGNPAAADGIAANASFNAPVGVTTDGTFVYVADTGNNKIRKIDSTGSVTTLGTSSASALTTDGTFLYLSDTSNHQVKRMELSGQNLITLAGTGPGNPFSTPRGIITDGRSLFICDEGSATIKRLQ